MAKRTKQQSAETRIDGKPVVGAIQAAQILTERAKQAGSTRVYSRDTVFRHYKNRTLIPALETPSGNLYYVEDIEKLPISPQIGKHSKAMEENG